MRRKNGITIGLILLAAVFLTVGVLRNEYSTVWVKAVNVCMECIGLG